MLQTLLSSTQSPFPTDDSRFRLQCAELQYRPCMKFLLYPAFHRLSAEFLWAPKGPFLSQLISSPWWSFSVCGDLPSPSASSQGCWSLFWLLFSFFLLSFVLLGVWSLLLMFSRCSVGIVPFVDEFLLYLLGATNSSSSYSAILTRCGTYIRWNITQP